MHELIGDITLCILFAWVLGLLAHFSRQPLILPTLSPAFSLVHSHGLNQVPGIDQRHLPTRPDLHAVHDRARNRPEKDRARRQGHPVRRGRAIMGGGLLGILSFLAIGLPIGGGKFVALFLCVACALSSTVMIVKYCMRTRTRYAARRGYARCAGAAGHLRDPVPAVQPSLGNMQASVILISIGRVGVLVATALAPSRYVLPRLFHQIARRPELILLGALAWCFLIGEIAENVHLSREMGSLVAASRCRHFPMRWTSLRKSRRCAISSYAVLCRAP